VAARGASAAFGGFGFALKTAATFDVFYWLQVTNYGVLYVLFDSAPSGSNYIDVWDLCLHAQTASAIISSQCFSDESRREQAEKLFDRVRKSCTDNQSSIAIRPFTLYGKRTGQNLHSFAGSARRLSLKPQPSVRRFPRKPPLQQLRSRRNAILPVLIFSCPR